MSSIDVETSVSAPLASAGRFVEAYVAANRAPSGDGARILLRAAELSRPAIVTLVPRRRPGEMTPSFDVHWEAEGGGPFPRFDGSLSIGANDDYDSFRLVLAGGYTPPGGISGELFDAIVGHRIATATAENLLATMRDAIVSKFAGEERAKAEHAKKPGA